MHREPYHHWQKGLISVIIPVLELKRGLRLRNPLGRQSNIFSLLEDLVKSAGVQLEVIVVCNSRDEDLIDMLSTHTRVDKYCLNSVNVGVARSWNMGTMLAEGEFLCFINDDVELAVDSLAKQVPLIDENPEIGMVGPRGAMWPALEPGTYAGENTITDVDAISGFMFITRRSIFDAIGGFDVAFTPAGCEEIDFAFAVRHAGFRCTVVPETNVIHHSSGGVSSKDMEIDYLGKRISTSDLAKKNLRLFQEKWRNK